MISEVSPGLHLSSSQVTPSSSGVEGTKLPPAQRPATRWLSHALHLTGAGAAGQQQQLEGRPGSAAPAAGPGTGTGRHTAAVWANE